MRAIRLCTRQLNSPSPKTEVGCPDQFQAGRLSTEKGVKESPLPVGKAATLWGRRGKMCVCVCVVLKESFSYMSNWLSQPIKVGRADYFSVCRNYKRQKQYYNNTEEGNTLETKESLSKYL